MSAMKSSSKGAVDRVVSRHSEFLRKDNLRIAALEKQINYLAELFSGLLAGEFSLPEISSPKTVESKVGHGISDNSSKDEDACVHHCTVSSLDSPWASAECPGGHVQVDFGSFVFGLSDDDFGQWGPLPLSGSCEFFNMSDSCDNEVMLEEHDIAESRQCNSVEDVYSGLDVDNRPYGIVGAVYPITRMPSELDTAICSGIALDIEEQEDEGGEVGVAIRDGSADDDKNDIEKNAADVWGGPLEEVRPRPHSGTGDGDGPACVDGHTGNITEESDDNEALVLAVRRKMISVMTPPRQLSGDMQSEDGQRSVSKYAPWLVPGRLVKMRCASVASDDLGAHDEWGWDILISFFVRSYLCAQEPAEVFVMCEPGTFASHRPVPPKADKAVGHIVPMDVTLVSRISKIKVQMPSRYCEGNAARRKYLKVLEKITSQFEDGIPELEIPEPGL